MSQDNFSDLSDKETYELQKMVLKEEFKKIQDRLQSLNSDLLREKEEAIRQRTQQVEREVKKILDIEKDFTKKQKSLDNLIKRWGDKSYSKSDIQLFKESFAIMNKVINNIKMSLKEKAIGSINHRSIKILSTKSKNKIGQININLSKKSIGKLLKL